MQVQGREDHVWSTRMQAVCSEPVEAKVLHVNVVGCVRSSSCVQVSPVTSVAMLLQHLGLDPSQFEVWDERRTRGLNAGEVVAVQVRDLDTLMIVPVMKTGVG